MGRKRRKKTNWTRDGTSQGSIKNVALLFKDGDLSLSGYTRLSDCPEIQTACLRLAELVASMTIYLMENTPEGDKRVTNELSRMVDIHPNRNMSRVHWMTVNVMNMLLYGHGNGVCVPHTQNGLLESLEPISPSRVSFLPVGNSYRDYRVLIDGQDHDPEALLHFVYNPDSTYPWKGRGVTVTLRDIAQNLKQAQKTENAFMSSEWKPSIIVRVDALIDELANPTGRRKLLDEYVKPAHPGDPWLIPAEQFQVEQVRPLSLADLAIKDTVELDKRTVASVVGVPPYLLGIGAFNRDEWNNFVQNKVRSIALSIQQEMTRCLLLSPNWYFALNFWSLIDYDLKTVSTVLLQGADRGYVNGDEWRDRMHMAPAGLTEYKVLENYIPYDMSGEQKKLKGGGEDP
jgi:HK97 family phage portal protein